jgi:hypothetical protein
MDFGSNLKKEKEKEKKKEKETENWKNFHLTR